MNVLNNSSLTNHTSTLLCSVVVPVFNGARSITLCLDALAQQTVDCAHYEVIVVDDGSTDGTAQIVQRWVAQHPTMPLQLLQQPNGGAAAARNTGAHAACAEIILFTDADCAPLPHWMETLLEAFADPATAGAKGTYLTNQSSLVARFVQSEYEDRYDLMAQHAQIDFIDTYSAAYRRAIFWENQGFDPLFRICEDQEFSFRLSQKGYRMVFVPRAQVRHLHDENVVEYFQRKYSIGFWKSLLTRLHPERMVHDTHTPQALKVQIVLCALLLGLSILGVAAFWLPLLRWAWLLFGLAVAAFLITMLPFWSKLARRSYGLALIAPLLVFTRALALGSGYLNGSIHFAGRTPGNRQPVIPGWKRAVKRVVDVTGALVGLALSIPFVAVAAIAVKLDSPGPVFYRQVRVGENGKLFSIIKLRSMVFDAERQLEQLINVTDLPEPVFKIQDDPRVTRVGRVLRRTSLDEAPQFINVLVGDMSLVGPRPEEVRIVKLYSDYQRRRLAVKPGLTGPMQINGRGSLCLADRLQLELEYIDHYSLRRDFAIILRTLPAILRGHGAY
jgi:lipopolysaccharide/colanic/teichoic acid biosynthesis glycosyltransferase/glycosyltransferase involved in cell wall biosynthesis